MIVLRDYQRRSIERCISYVKRNPKKHPLIALPTGAGKSYVISGVIEKLINDQPDINILVISHVQEILEQDYKSIKEHTKLDVGIYSKGLHRQEIKQVTVAGIQSIFRKAEYFKKFTFIIIDECFTGNTDIDMLDGVKKIKDVKVGDIAKNATGYGRVEAISKKHSNNIIEVNLENGIKFECTRNHKIFTTEGWVEACSLDGKEVLGNEEMRELRDRISSIQDSNRANIQQNKILWDILQQEDGECDVYPRGEGENDRYHKKNRSQTMRKRGKWGRNDAPTKRVIEKIRNWLASRIRGCNRGENIRRTSDLLQDRYSKQRNDDSYRGRWANSLWKKKRARQKEDSVLRGIRVESIKDKKQGCPEFVYNLQVSGHPSYFANSILAHNCHLIAPGSNTMYRKFLAALPEAVCFGVTATPFRLKSGYIYGQEDSLFNDLIYDLTSRDKFNELIEQGYLCNLRIQGTTMDFDPEGVKTTAGDFDNKELSHKFNREAITSRAVQELIARGKGRKKWLVFAIDIEHAESIALELSNNGITTMVIHSKIDFDRNAIINGFKSGVFKCIVNVNVLTTGFDDPEIDLIALLRPTKSPVVHIQTIGRGLRISPGKKDCLILDFAGNTERLGAINDITIKKPKKGVKTGKPITKRCPDCDAIHHPTVKICEFCGHKFIFQTLLNASASGEDILADGKPKWVTVTNVTYSLHKKVNSPSMMKVTYECGLRSYKEFVCIEHVGYAQHKAKHWLTYRGLNNVSTAINAVHNSNKLKIPNRLLIDRSGKYPLIKEFSF